MIEEDLEIAIKVVVVGNGAVGKSSLIQRYCKGSFTKEYKKTIGVDFLERQLRWVCCRLHLLVQLEAEMLAQVDPPPFLHACLLCRVGGEDTRLMLWDTAGQEEFDAITKAYYRGWILHAELASQRAGHIITPHMRSRG